MSRVKSVSKKKSPIRAVKEETPSKEDDSTNAFDEKKIMQSVSNLVEVMYSRGDFSDAAYINLFKQLR